MSDDQYLDTLKQFGYRVHRCPTCGFRAMGAAVTCHELVHKDHGAMRPEAWESRDIEPTRAEQEIAPVEAETRS